MQKIIEKYAIGICLLVILFFVSSCFIAVSKMSKVPDIDHWESYYVKSGDTLWEIVPKSEDYDIRAIIHAVQEHNGITNSTLLADEYIELPVYKEG